MIKNDTFQLFLVIFGVMMICAFVLLFSAPVIKAF